MAVGCGAMVISHANDSYFWVVSQFSGLKVDLAYKCHSLGTLDEVGALAAFLASPAASGMTGQTLYVDAGDHATR